MRHEMATEHVRRGPSSRIRDHCPNFENKSMKAQYCVFCCIKFEKCISCVLFVKVLRLRTTQKILCSMRTV